MSSTILAVLVVSCVLIDAAVGLKCFECSSMDDDKCGKTFGYSVKEARKKGLETTCEGTVVACKKTESRDTLSSVVVVSRSCWNATAAEKLDDEFFECKTLMVRSEVCYCKAGENDDPCNGQERINANIIFSLLGLLPFILKSLF